MIIKDAIHGNIRVGDFEKRVMDCPDFQRLRRIKQLGMTYLVYPGATHTRLEHSIGTMQVASRICEQLGIGGEEKEKVRLYGLLHDLGHTAFSHESEKVLRPFFGSHEEIGKRRMEKGEMWDVLSEKYGKAEISGLGKGIERVVVGGDVGADRMDYLLRDAYHIGVAYGMVDVDRIIHTLTLEDEQLVVDRRGLEAAESLLVGRFMMFSTVYLHKTVRSSSAMLNQGLKTAIDEGVEPEKLLDGTDDEILHKMIESGKGGEYARALLERKLYKQAWSVEGTPENPEELCRELSSRCSCEILVDLPPVLSKPLDIKIKTGEGLLEILEISDLVRSLFIAEKNRKETLVFCPKGNREKVASEAKGLL